MQVGGQIRDLSIGSEAEQGARESEQAAIQRFGMGRRLLQEMQQIRQRGVDGRKQQIPGQGFGAELGDARRLLGALRHEIAAFLLGAVGQFFQARHEPGRGGQPQAGGMEFLVGLHPALRITLEFAQLQGLQPGRGFPLEEDAEVEPSEHHGSGVASAIEVGHFPVLPQEARRFSFVGGRGGEVGISRLQGGSGEINSEPFPGRREVGFERPLVQLPVLGGIGEPGSVGKDARAFAHREKPALQGLPIQIHGGQPVMEWA